MKQMIKFEIYRAIINFRFFIALIMGFIIGFLQFYSNVLPESQNLKKYLQFSGSMITIPSSYEMWLGSDLYGVYSFCFFLILPILSVFPYGTSGFSDKKDGYIKSVCTRTKKKNYYASKFIAVVISAFLVIVLPLFFNLFLTMTSLPSLIPEIAASTSSIRNRSIFCELYYSHPFIHSVLFILLDGVFGSLYAVLALLLSDASDYKIVIFLFPFLFHIFIYSLCDMLSFSMMAPIHFLRSGWGESNYITVLLYIVFITAISIYFCILRKGKNDVL